MKDKVLIPVNKYKKLLKDCNDLQSIICWINESSYIDYNDNFSINIDAAFFKLLRAIKPELMDTMEYLKRKEKFDAQNQEDSSYKEQSNK